MTASEAKGLTDRCKLRPTRSNKQHLHHRWRLSTAGGDSLLILRVASSLQTPRDFVLLDYAWYRLSGLRVLWF